MQTKIYEKLTPELKTISNFFHRHTTQAGYKKVYKEWQRLLNSYLDNYDEYASKYAPDKKPIKPNINPLLITRFKDFQRVSQSIVRYNSTNKLACSEALTKIYADLPAYLNNTVKAYLSKEIAGVVIKPTSTKSTFGTSNSVVKTLKDKPLGVTKKIKITAPPMTIGSMLKEAVVKKEVTKPVPVKLKHDIPVKLTVGGKAIDLTPLLDIPEVKDYLEKQQQTIIKAKNAQRATELANEIKSLGFDVEFS